VSHYSRGRALEYDIRTLFERAGWSVIRGAGSKGEVDGMKADLVATKRSTKNIDTVWMVAFQCKRTTRTDRKHQSRNSSAPSPTITNGPRDRPCRR
jgi:Holliday junction resolvase